MAFFQRFFKLESASSILLFLMAITAMLWANSPLAYLHDRFIAHSLFWINEGLMALFFLVIGIELKRGFLEGPLAKPSQIVLPAVAACGGMLLPALIYCYFNYQDAQTLRGWATPVATDIAFAVGVLSLFARRLPPALKLFLLALAIFDDIGAILIIALFYSQGIEFAWLLLSILFVTVLLLFNYLRLHTLTSYLFVGVWLWLALFHAGIHPTIAGVILALCLPEPLLKKIETRLHPWVAYAIMPLFALANAGFSLHLLSWRILFDKVVLGIALGLFVGKQLGVFIFSWFFIHLKLMSPLQNTSWLALYGVALLCGIGFTMSLFLGTLSFSNNSLYLAEVRLGVLIGSILSGLSGAAILSIALRRK